MPESVQYAKILQTCLALICMTKSFSHTITANICLGDKTSSACQTLSRSLSRILNWSDESQTVPHLAK